ncbi:hypothetical protein SAMN05421688_2656 [Poseidonocella pacifica]|uniref:Uncharacterized protein n=1 Tax=Poseidonocella pacifica TaxID=871651 RepID=A0A1I0XYW9_9RHOB|nr:hypothetical protein [Poseidonocella pacifica]SFB06104.1 hypothetical protein SAMN05421688_2656 [Poseidonocella pacifica]
MKKLVLAAFAASTIAAAPAMADNAAPVADPFISTQTTGGAVPVGAGSAGGVGVTAGGAVAGGATAAGLGGLAALGATFAAPLAIGGVFAAITVAATSSDVSATPATGTD